ncbi:MAG: hypothetical protein LBQ60_06935 [Bacteroidales bacterium]|jgi:hypothetical protein|nr:hypothetical protein [Bacteroidales bacterium]
MPRKTFAELLNSAQVILAGLEGNAMLTQRRDIDTELLSQPLFSTTRANNKQEKLKADLKSKTAELKELQESLNKELATNKKIVKSDIPPAQWKEYGCENLALSGNAMPLNAGLLDLPDFNH